MELTAAVAVIAIASNNPTAWIIHAAWPAYGQHKASYNIYLPRYMYIPSLKLNGYRSVAYILALSEPPRVPTHALFVIRISLKRIV